MQRVRHVIKQLFCLPPTHPPQHSLIAKCLPFNIFSQNLLLKFCHCNWGVMKTSVKQDVDQR